MARIKKVEFTYKRPGLNKDNTGAYVGYQIDARSNGKRFRNVFSTRKKAEGFIEQLREKRIYTRAGLPAPAGTVENVTLSQLFDKRLKAIKHPKEIIRAKRVFKTFQDIFNIDEPLISHARSAHFQIYINNRLADGIKPQSVHREITILSTAFRTAAAMFPVVLEGYEPPRIPRPVYRKLKRRRRVITDTEKNLLITSILNDRLPQEREVRTKARPIVALMFELAWMLGLRYSEITHLLKTDFNRDARSLRVVRWKTGDVSLLEFLPDRAMEILDTASNASESPTIFDLRTSQHTTTAILQAACEANNIKYGRSEVDGVTWHSTRHSFTSRIVQVADLATVKSYTGHSTSEMVEWYAHPSQDARREAMARLYGSTKNEQLVTDLFNETRAGNLTLDEFILRLDQLLV